MLRLDDLHLLYGRVHALKGVSLSMEKGEIVTILGANGAGKSSLLKAISGLHPCKSGKIFFSEEEVTSLPPHGIVARGISHCPEGRRIFADLSVRENLLMGGYLLRKNEVEDRLQYVMSLFPRLGHRFRQTGGTLSGGEQQMLAIGRALMSNPRLLMLDEPSLGLAPLVVEKILETLTELNQRGLSVLLVEQNAHAALQISHWAVVLETGKVTLSGPSRELASDERIVRAYLGG